MMASHYPSSLYTYTRNYLLENEIAFPSLSDSEFEAWVQDLAKELEAAVADRIIEWKDARDRAMPLGELFPRKQANYPGLHISGGP